MESLMKIALVTGSAGLIGSESVRFFCEKNYKVVGIDNDMRRMFFGDDASTMWNRRQLEEQYPSYEHHSIDIRDQAAVEKVFKSYGNDIRIIIHTAAQPSHDWGALDPITDFSINAQATVILLQCTRQYCPEASFIFTSTNKVYGDTPNNLPLVELESRWELDPSHPFHARGIDESMSVDKSKHSFLGASKTAADIMVQEFGRYFGINTACFRGGCLTGSFHSGTMMHGFLSYLIKCCLTGTTYNIYGYKGKQVRDNIHSIDLVNMFWEYAQAPRPGEVYNAGGSRHSNCSVLEAIRLCEDVTGRKMKYSYQEKNRSGDHIWWISDITKFRSHYPRWEYTYSLRSIIKEIAVGIDARL